MVLMSRWLGESGCFQAADQLPDFRVEGKVTFASLAHLANSIADSGMVAASKLGTNRRKGVARQRSGHIHGDLPSQYDIRRTALGNQGPIINAEVFGKTLADFRDTEPTIKNKKTMLQDLCRSRPSDFQLKRLHRRDKLQDASLQIAAIGGRFFRDVLQRIVMPDDSGLRATELRSKILEDCESSLHVRLFEPCVRPLQTGV